MAGEVEENNGDEGWKEEESRRKWGNRSGKEKESQLLVIKSDINSILFYVILELIFKMSILT